MWVARYSIVVYIYIIAWYRGRRPSPSARERRKEQAENGQLHSGEHPKEYEGVGRDGQPARLVHQPHACNHMCPKPVAMLTRACHPAEKGIRPLAKRQCLIHRGCGQPQPSWRAQPECARRGL